MTPDQRSVQTVGGEADAFLAAAQKSFGVTIEVWNGLVDYEDMLRNAPVLVRNLRDALAALEEQSFQRTLSIDLGPTLGEWGVNTLCEFILTASTLLGIPDGDYAALMQLQDLPAVMDPRSPAAARLAADTLAAASEAVGMPTESPWTPEGLRMRADYLADGSESAR